MPFLHKELIIGGQRSGKTTRAENLAAQWLQQAKQQTEHHSPQHKVVYVATAQAHDDEMRARIARHRQDRALRLPQATTIESTNLTLQLQTHSHADTAIVIDCLTLWLAQLYFPHPSADNAICDAKDINARIDTFLQALSSCQAQVYIVSNEIGLGVVATHAQTRAFVDALGLLNQRVAAICSHVTLMAAGLPLTLKQPH